MILKSLTVEQYRGFASRATIEFDPSFTLLNELWKAAIQSTLAIRGRGPAALDARRARQRIASLTSAEQGNGQLEPFCFVLLQVLESHLQRLMAIRKNQGAQA